MPFTVTSPYGDDQTRTKQIPKILEEFIAANWNQTKTGVAVGDIAFNTTGDKILHSSKDITLKAYSIFKNVTPLDVSRRRRQVVETVIIDVYVLNNNDDVAREERANKMMKFLEELFITNQQSMDKGIYEVEFKGDSLSNDPFSSNISRFKTTVDVVFIMDITEI